MVDCRHPMVRIGKSEDMAAAAFLSSDEASFITGKVLYVCGGGLSIYSAPM
jgi:NAD(P)-dependent dehydrogenase (short-subunit alcohol dehydrogenase family)